MKPNNKLISIFLIILVTPPVVIGMIWVMAEMMIEERKAKKEKKCLHC